MSEPTKERDFLAATIESLQTENACLRVELESRCIWIEKMNAILGYDNSDGFHSRPDPHEIATSLRAELAAAREKIRLDWKMHECGKSVLAVLKAAWKSIADMFPQVAGSNVEAQMIEVRAAVQQLCAGREALAQWMISRGYATGHGDSVADLLGALGWQVDEQRDNVRAELEAAKERIAELEKEKVILDTPFSIGELITERDRLRADLDAAREALLSAVLAVSEKLNAHHMLEHDLQQRGRPDEAREWNRFAAGIDEAMIILAEKFPDIKELEEWR